MLIPSEQKLLNVLGSRVHPEFFGKLIHWNFLYQTYLGGREWFTDNIFRFVREGDATYAGRIQRAYRFNHTREVVDLVNKYLFKTPAIRSESPPPYLERFRKCATLNGLSLEDFERQVGRMSSIFGRVYVVMDNTLNPDQGPAPLSQADEKTGDARLYAYIVTPDCFRDCGYDNYGHYEWVLLAEKFRDDDDPITASGIVKTRYRLWTKTEWALFEVNTPSTRAQRAITISPIAVDAMARQKVGLTFIRQGKHDLGVVPVLRADHIQSDEKYAVPALIEDVAYLDRANANYLSNLDQIINDQTFSQLVMAAQAVLPGVSTASKTSDAELDAERRREAIKLGTSQILLYDGEHGSAPAYINPDPRQATLIITTIKQIINEIYHTVGLAGERTKQDNSMGIDNSSGVAKAFDFERVSALLSAKASSMQAFSNKLEALARIYGGEPKELFNEIQNTVIYAMSFDVRGLADEISIGHELALLGLPMEVRRKQIKGIIDKLWPLLPETEKNKLETAIDGWVDSMQTSVSGDVSSNADGGTLGQGAVGGQAAMK